MGCARSWPTTSNEGNAEKVTCPVCVGCGESDEFFLGQPEALMRHLTAPATLTSFTDAEGAGAHCRDGAQRLRADCACRAAGRVRSGC
jgi:hypothetical protein